MGCFRTAIFFFGLFSFYSAAIADVQYFPTDHLGSVELVLNDNGGILQKVTYSPFGEILEKQSFIDASAPPLYTSQEFDWGVDFHYYSARYYDSTLSHFLSIDPEVLKSREPYGYVSGNPIRNIDPDGKMVLPETEEHVQASQNALGELGRVPLQETGIVSVVGLPFLTAYGLEVTKPEEGKLFAFDIHYSAASPLPDGSGHRRSITVVPTNLPPPAPKTSVRFKNPMVAGKYLLKLMGLSLQIQGGKTIMEGELVVRDGKLTELKIVRFSGITLSHPMAGDFYPREAVSKWDGTKVRGSAVLFQLSPDFIKALAETAKINVDGLACNLLEFIS
jgi:RHS repeat-associated protein